MIQIPPALPLERIASLPGLQEKRMAWVFFYFPAQTTDHILEQDLITIAISTPDRFDDFLQTKNKARTTHQQMEQSKFKIGQSDLRIIRIDYTSPPRQSLRPTYFPFKNLIAVYLFSIQFYGGIKVLIPSLNFPLYSLYLKMLF
jgi:hypothetical protein